jgi:hypothetical protein
MPVQLILDYFGIDNEDALQVENSETSVNTSHQRIRQYLREQSPSMYRIRLTNPALYHRFEYLEGMEDVLPTLHLIPRLLLAEKFKTTLPDWLSDQLIVALNLLNTPTPKTDFDGFAEQLLSVCATDLILGQDFYAFIHALNLQPPAFLSLLAQDSVKKRLLKRLSFDFKINKETAELFIAQLIRHHEIQSFLITLAYQQHLFQLRGIINRYALNIALPAQTLPTPLFALSLLPLTEAQGQSLVEKFLLVLNSCVRKILAEEISAEALTELLFVDWSAIWTELEHLIDLSPSLINDALAQKVASFTSPQASVLAEKLSRNTYLALAPSASVEDALTWSQGYFDYCRHAFLYKQPLDEAINSSFSDWLVNQTARIARSKSDWRQCSERIHEFLQADYLVVVMIVDALSALNQELVLAELQSLAQYDHLVLQSDILFAPLPTLTEVGKMAVLTGKPAASVPSDQENALRETYQQFLPEPEALKIIRSWKESSEHLENQTNLLVFFENRLDERLHDCSSFEKHCADLKPISSQIKMSIQRWAKDAMSLGRDIVFFVTADHGMTVTQTAYSGEPLGEIKERVFKLNAAIDLPDGFVKIIDYAVPKSRLRLTPNALLTHGGLTPEEVLIPFITLTSKPPQASKMPLEVSLAQQNCKKLSSKQWQLELSLTASLAVDSINLTLAPPFAGKCTIDSLRANKSQILILNFSSEQDQEGLTEMTLLLTYHRAGAYEENQKLLSVQFPASLLEKDASTQDFEDMF